MTEVHYHCVPPGDITFQDGAPITRLPLDKGHCDRVYAVLLTSDQLMPQPHSLGAILPEHSDVKSALHLLLSIALSHRDNLAQPLPGYEKRPRAHLISRAFVPDPANPQRFAILFQVVIGAVNVPTCTRNPNVSARTAPVSSRAPPPVALPPLGGARPVGSDVFAASNPFAQLFSAFTVSPVAAGAADPAGEGAKPDAASGNAASQPLKGMVIAIEDVPAYMALRLRASERKRYSECANAARLFHVGSFRSGEEPSPQQGLQLTNSWDLLHWPEVMGYTQYLHGLLQPLARAGWDRLVPERSSLSTEVMAMPLPASDLEELEGALREEQALWFSSAAWRTMSALRLALSLPVALRALSHWVAGLGAFPSPSVHQDWFRLRAYMGRGKEFHTSPLGCFVTVEAVQDSEHTGLSLDRALLRPLPLCRGLRDILGSAACQLALLNASRSTFLTVMDTATALQLSDRLWLPGVRTRYVAEVRAHGSLEARSHRPADEAGLLRFVLRNIDLMRSIPPEVGALKLRGVVDRARLLGGERTPEPWEEAMLQRQVLRDFEMLMASGADRNVIAWATHCFFTLGCEPATTTSEQARGRAVDMASELENFRRVFAGRLFSDLTGPSDMLAKLGIAVRQLTGLVRLWPENLLVLLFVLSSFIDEGERPHLEISGLPASGKTVTLVSILQYLPEFFARQFVYRTMASQRDPSGSMWKNVAEIFPESGNRGEFDRSGDRAVVLSNMSEGRQVSSTIRIDPLTNRRSEETCVQLRSNSCIFATNLETKDEAFISRMMVMVMSALPVRAQFFGEMRAQNRSQHDPELHLTLQRAVSFFVRCVAGYCMLVNCGAVQAPTHALNEAVLNRLLPADTDASTVRSYLQLFKLCRTLECMHTVFRFLTDPHSPLTVLFNDRLDLQALCLARVYDVPHCSIPVYIASAAPRLRRSHLLPRIANLLLLSALLPKHSEHRAVLREFAAAVRQCRVRHSGSNSARDAALKALHLEFLPRLFPPRAVAHSSILPSEKPVFFVWEAGLHRHAPAPADRPTDNYVSAAVATGAAGEVVHDGDAGRDGPLLRPVGAVATDLGASQRDDEAVAAELLMMRDDALHDFAVLTELDGDELARAKARFVQLLLAEARARRTTLLDGLDVGHAGASSRAAAGGGASKARRGGREFYERYKIPGQPDAASVPKWEDAEVNDALHRMRLRFYDHGFASVDVTCLDCDESSRLKRKLEELRTEFSMPTGGYVTHGHDVPFQCRGAEAFPLIKIESSGERSLETVLDVEGGQSQSRLRRSISASLLNGFDSNAESPEPSFDLTVEGLRARAHLTYVREAMGMLDDRTAATLSRVLRCLDCDSLPDCLQELAYRAFPAGPDDPRGDPRTVQALSGCFLLGGVGNWGARHIFRGVPVPYHVFEARDRRPSSAAGEALPPYATSASSNSSRSPSPSMTHGHKRGTEALDGGGDWDELVRAYNDG